MRLHSPIAVLAVSMMVVGCQSERAPDGDAATSPSAQPGSSATVIDINIAGGNVTPVNAEFEATVKQPIELRVNSDANDELHVHSVPEHTFAVKPEPNQVFTFTVDVPGRVEIEVHELDRTVGTIQVRQ